MRDRVLLPLTAMTATMVPLLLLSLSACEEKKIAEPSSGRATATPSASAVDDAELRFGHVGSLTGQEATFGVSTDNGIKLAIKEINDGGGIKSKKIRLITYDDQGRPTEAAAATTKLIVQDKVHVVLGEVASSRSLAMAPIAQTNRIPMITPSSTNPKVTEGKDFVFRVCFIDPFQGTVMARFAAENLKVKKVAVLTDIRNDYSVGLASYFVEHFKKLGGEIVSDQKYSAGDIDFKAQLTAIRGTSPEAIFVPGYYTDVGLIARQAKELGLSAPLLGGDGWESPKLFEIGGESLDGAYYSNHMSTEDPSPRIQKFMADYKAAYGEIPDSLAALGYDAVKVAVQAIGRAKSFSGEDIREQLAATNDFPGVTGSITMNADRNAVKPAVVLKIGGGKAVYQTTVAP